MSDTEELAEVYLPTPHYDSAGQAISHLAESFVIDRWAWQKVRVELWVHEDYFEAVEPLSGELVIPLVIFGGRTPSAADLEEAVARLGPCIEDGQEVVILFCSHERATEISDLQDRLIAAFGSQPDKWRVEGPDSSTWREIEPTEITKAVIASIVEYQDPELLNEAIEEEGQREILRAIGILTGAMM